MEQQQEPFITVIKRIISFSAEVNNEQKEKLLLIAKNTLYQKFQNIKKMIEQRSFGAGICYKNKRFNAGADVLVAKSTFYDASIGVNYVPFNDALLAADFTFEQKKFFCF